MPISNKVNGVWMNLSYAYSKVNGVWRFANISNNINGVWRSASDSFIVDEKDIVGFHFVYRLNKNQTHPRHPLLHYNPNLPIYTELTGYNPGMMDESLKGIMLHYENKDPSEEGIICYDANLYAILHTGQMIDAGRIQHNPLANQFGQNNAGMLFENLSITIDARVQYECFGYYMDGWNTIFNKEQFIDYSQYTDEGPHRDVRVMDNYAILPFDKRGDTFDPSIMIGIARDMTTTNMNMVGSYGTLDHNIHAIQVNGVNKPFVIHLINE